MNRKVIIGDIGMRSTPGPRSVVIKAQPVEVDFTDGKTSRRIAASMANAIAAGIRAIDEPVSEATLARRAEDQRQMAFDAWIKGAEKGRKRRTRKHLGRGTWGNNTGVLADKLRVHWTPEGPTVTLFETRADPSRLNPETFGDRYEAFRAKLMRLVRELHDPHYLWQRPNVQKTIADVVYKMTKVSKTMAWRR